MFEEITSSPQILHIGRNILKGGDFMEQEQKIPSREIAIKRAIERMKWEGAPLVVKNSSFPERKGRIRFNTGVSDKPGIKETG